MNKRQQKKLDKKIKERYKDIFSLKSNAVFDIFQQQILGFDWEYKELTKCKKGKLIKVQYRVKKIYTNRNN